MSDDRHQHGSFDREALTARIESYFDGLLSEQAVRDLEAELRADPEAMRHYLAWMSLHSELSWTRRASGEGDSVVHTLSAKGEPRDKRGVAGRIAGGAAVRAWVGRVTALAAAIALVAGVWLTMSGDGAPTGGPDVATSEPQGPPVATLTDSADAVWSADSSVHDLLEPGVEVPAGPVRLQSGFAQIIFKSGAVVTLLGPTEMRMTGPNSCELDRGALMAFVPERALGFTVETPEAKIVDIGTEFGVRVDADGRSDLHVFDGTVRVLTDRTGLSTHHGGDAMRFAAAGDTEIDPLTKADFRDALGVTLPFRYAHWSFDAMTDEATPGDGHGFEAGTLTGQARRLSNANAYPALADGRFGKALRLHGKGDNVRTGFEGVGSDTARTIAMWVKAPVDHATDEGFSLVHWGTHEPGSAWQISLNPRKEDGPTGRLRIGINGGQAVGSTDLRDGRWHHVAVVFLGGVHSDIATHTRLYVDGQLEHLGAASPQRVDTAIGTSGRAHPVTIGRNITGQTTGQAGFRGLIDELYIFDIALSQRQIEQLMTDNRPPAQP